MEEQHMHCINCVSKRCMARPENGVSCDLIGCPLVCGAVFHSCKADEHRILCPLERVPCLNKGFGCPFTVTRNKIAEHLEICPASVVCCTMEWNRWPVSYADRKSYENLSKDIDKVEQLDMALALQDQRMLLESLKVATMVSKTTDKQIPSREKNSVSTNVPENPSPNGLIDMDEESYRKLYCATIETTRSLAAALDILNNATRDIDMINGGSVEEQFEDVQVKDRNILDDVLNVEMRDDGYIDENEVGAVGGMDHHDVVVQRLRDWYSCPEKNTSDCVFKDSDVKDTIVTSICNGFHAVGGHQNDLDHDEMDLDTCDTECSKLMNGSCIASEEAFGRKQTMPYHSLSVIAHQPSANDTSPLDTLRNGSLPHLPLPFDSGQERRLDRKIDDSQGIRGIAVFAYNGRRPFLVDPYWFRAKMEDKSVDTSDLEITEDPMGLQGIDLITAALLFCLGDSPGGRGISDSRNVDGYHVDFGTQTFSLPSAILATNTMVGEIASASACDHANPQLSNPSPFQTLGLDLVLECVARYQTKQRSMFTFVCGQLFRRDEFSSHFKNVHGDIHAGLNGWMEHRCPLAYYGCTYSQRRFCPSTQGSKVIHDRHLRSFGVQPHVLTALLEHVINRQNALESSVDHLSRLPFEVLQHIAGFLDGFSLCQFSRVSRLMRDVCASLLQGRGMVILLWEKRQHPNGTLSWQIKDKVWRFSTAFGTVSEWKFADISSMADHLRTCKYNTIERREEAIPLPCMCVTRELTKEGRSLRSVLKPVL
uniref:F-box only protein 30 n=1 Tax=Latimeria chalumnae TaxID=7897 RepID=H3AC23_LATCH